MAKNMAKSHVATWQASRLPGLSPRGRAVLARLECTRLWPGAAGEALQYWSAYVRDPYARQWDRPDSCGLWECCPDIEQVREVLGVVLRNLPLRDARRLRGAMETSGVDLP